MNADYALYLSLDIMLSLRNIAGIPLFCLICTTAYAHDVTITSPDGRICIKVTDGGESADRQSAGFSVAYDKTCILPYVRLGMNTDQSSFGQDLTLVSAGSAQAIAEDYRMITGKRSHCLNKGTEQTICFENRGGERMNVTFRIFNDGIAFRYELTSKRGKDSITDEKTTYILHEGTKRWMQIYSPDSYERFFPPSSDGYSPDDPKASLWGYPALIQTSDSVYALLTESDIHRNHCCSFLNNQTDRNQYKVCLADERLPFTDKWISPWRLLIVGSLANIVESTLVTDVAAPSQIKDTDWIRPGTASWIYWAYNHGTRDFQLVKEYIDLAAEMHWPYNLIDWEWSLMGNGGNIQDALNYAASKGIKPFLWYNSSTNWVGEHAPQPQYLLNTKEKREKEYAWLQKMGVAGLKIDFFPNDKATTVNYYLDLLEDAARYQLMINFHGATIPRGWQRTYPNLMSVEGVYGAEWYNNTPVLTKRAAAHNATLPFTRNVVGPMDYTPGTFSNSQHPHITTYAHELALPILFECAIQHMPDRPSAYRSLPQEVKKLLSALPTAWDDTRLLTGYPGTEVVLARRKGDIWYIAGINGTDEERTISFSTDRLQLSDQTNHSVTWFKDGKTDTCFDIESQSLTPAEKNIQIPCRPRGGFVAVIR